MVDIPLPEPKCLKTEGKLTAAARFENTYPGVRCDIPAHAYQSGFSPNSQWSEEFAQGAEIRNYWQSVARKYNVYQYLRFQRQVQRAEWLPEEGKWKVTIEHLDSGEVSHLVSISQCDRPFTKFVLGHRRKTGCRDQCHRALQRLEATRLPWDSRLQRRNLPFLQLEPQC